MECDEIYCAHLDPKTKECTISGLKCKDRIDGFIMDIQEIKNYLKRTIEARNATEPNAQEILRRLNEVFKKYGI